MYPCDYPDQDGHYNCPFCSDENDYVSCRDCCGLGVDENGDVDYDI